MNLNLTVQLTIFLLRTKCCLLKFFFMIFCVIIITQNDILLQMLYFCQKKKQFTVEKRTFVKHVFVDDYHYLESVFFFNSSFLRLFKLTEQLSWCFINKSNKRSLRSKIFFFGNINLVLYNNCNLL